MRQTLAILSSSFLVLACGSSGGGSTTDAPGGSSIDADPNAPDAAPIDALTPANCVAGTTQCTDCIDNDGDGRADGFDPECTGPLDNDEGSFATGIPGDNRDTVKQDCFFDGNSGSGDDGCEIHACCLLGAVDQASCPVGANQYDPTECNDAQAQTCVNTCLPLVPAGCDCFGCCTVCDPATNNCRDIITNPATAPNCNDGNILDPVACPSCAKAMDCNNPCNPEMCILCPGQDPSDLPAACGGNNECPGTQASCTNAPCAEGKYCSNGCCVTIVD